MTTRSASRSLEPRGESGRAQAGGGHELSASHRPHAAGRQDLVQHLSAEERLALTELAHDPPRQSVPRHCAVRLLHLGLAELDCGRLLLTSEGRNAVIIISGR